MLDINEEKQFTALLKEIESLSFPFFTRKSTKLSILFSKKNEIEKRVFSIIESSKTDMLDFDLLWNKAKEETDQAFGIKGNSLHMINETTAPERKQANAFSDTIMTEIPSSRLTDKALWYLPLYPELNSFYLQEIMHRYVEGIRDCIRQWK